MTNREWLDSLSDEDYATLLFIMLDCKEDEVIGKISKRIGVPIEKISLPSVNIAAHYKWLKEEHY